MPEQAQESESKETPRLDDSNLIEDEQPEKPPTPLERILRRLKKACQGSRPPSPATRKELGKDKSKALFAFMAAAIVVFLLFLTVFSSPQKPKRKEMGQHDSQPDLGRRITLGQEQQADSVTPLLKADTREQASPSNGEVTPEDIKRTSQSSFEAEAVKPNITANTLIPPTLPTRSNAQAAAAGTSTAMMNSKSGDQYALSHINFSDPALQQEYAKAGNGPNYAATTAPSPAPNSSNSASDLKKPSLVFVRSENASTNPGENLAHRSNPVSYEARSEPPSLDSVLPAGTRLVARLESAVSTAVAAPVVAAIEYNYERDGEIVVPAGSKAIGKLEQANSSGYVSLHFNTIVFPDGTNEKMEGVSMSLGFAPVKGLVGGRKRGARFLVQTLTGMGTLASYLVGAGNFSGPLSESGLMRERLADNVGIAGQNELNQLAFNQNIMVTVPGNTRFYIVLEQSNGTSGRKSSARQMTSAARSIPGGESVPNLQELRQLMQLQRELSQLYQPGAGENPQSSDSQNQ